MKEPHERLQFARAQAGFDQPTEAARRMGMKVPTYLAHENGSRGFKAKAQKYAQKYGVALEWLLTGMGPREPLKRVPVLGEQRTVPVVGYVAAGALHYGGNPGQVDEVAAPDWATESTVAVEIRGESLGALFDRWIVFYDDVRRPVTADLIGSLCVVGLSDDRVMIKKLQRSRTKGLFHLLSNTEAPILDVAVEWAAKVKDMRPR